MPRVTRGSTAPPIPSHMRQSDSCMGARGETVVGSCPYCLVEPDGKEKDVRRLVLLVLLVAVLVLAAAPIASAHVHGITPLGCGIGSANDGGNGTNGTPADDANGGPIAGLIPRDTGNAPLTVGDGGFRPANNPHCA